MLSRSGPSTAPVQALQSNPPAINQATGAQQLVEFNDIRQRVHEKIREYNLDKQPEEETKKITSDPKAHSRHMSFKEANANSA